VGLGGPPEGSTLGGMPGKRDPTIRFAVGTPAGARSSVWRVWAAQDGSIYVAARAIAGEFKASLHGSGDWRVGFTQESRARRKLLAPGRDRIIDRFSPPAETAPGMRRGFTIVIPWLAVVESSGVGEMRAAGPVTWLEPLSEGQVTEVAMTVVAPTVRINDVGPGITRVGVIPIPTGGTLWVTAFTRRANEAEVRTYQRAQREFGAHPNVRAAATDGAIFRGLFGGPSSNGSQFFLDLAIPT
jgi:hypothetical protein